MSNKLSRRDFLKGSAASAAALAATSLLGGAIVSAEESSDEIVWDREYDVVIAGAGGTGVCAAAAAAEAGASVMVFEKSGVMGGTTNYSGGVMQAAGTDIQKKYSDYQDDTPEKHAAEWIAEGEGMLDEDLVKDLANGAPDCISWLADSCGIEWVNVYGHCHVPYVDESLMADRIHVYKDGGNSGSGGIYVQAVWKYAEGLGAEVEYNTEVSDLIVVDGRVAGVEITVDGATQKVRAAKGVILATAGLDHNEELSKELNPQQYWINTDYPGTCLCAATDTGDGIRMGLKLGAAFVTGGTIDFCGKTGAGTDNRTPIFPEFIVNNAGMRFVCEDATYAYHYRAIFQQEKSTGAPTYMIFGSNGGSVDAKVSATDGTSYAWSGDALAEAVESGELQTADTIEELAEKIGVNPTGLSRTLAAWNEDTAAGNQDPYGRIEGLEPLEAPYYAYRNTPFNLGALGGLKITQKCEVVDVEGNTIPGLYAAGLCAGGWVGPYYPGSGTAIIGTCYFGRVAGAAAAEN
jgi:fumarate reductase flavoprotein subunit